MRAGDLGENAQRLKDRLLALLPKWQAHIFADIGVRDGVSSEIMVEVARSQPCVRVAGVDINQCPPSLVEEPLYAFRQSDSVTALAEADGSSGREPEVSAGMLDTLHIAEQVMCETYFLWPHLRVGGFLAYHDTCWPDWKHDVYLGRSWDRPELGIARMFAGRPEVRIETFPESYGMTFVTKLADFDLRNALDWRPAFEARNLLLALVPPGVEAKEIWP